jgi:hypothetical protein
MEYKYIELLSCSFEASDDVYVRQQVGACGSLRAPGPCCTGC